MTVRPAQDLFDPPEDATKSRIDLQIELNYEVSAPGADFIFNLHAARTELQRLPVAPLFLDLQRQAARQIFGEGTDLGP